jgi:hypothetical protein
MSLESDPASIAVGFPLIFNLEMRVEPHSIGDFEIEVLAPNTLGAQAKVCLIEVAFRGSNMGCMSEPTVEFYSRGGGNAVADRAVFPATRIGNCACKSEEDDPEANIVRFRIVAQVCICMSCVCDDCIILPCRYSITGSTTLVRAFSSPLLSTWS